MRETFTVSNNIYARNKKATVHHVKVLFLYIVVGDRYGILVTSGKLKLYSEWKNNEIVCKLGVFFSARPGDVRIHVERRWQRKRYLVTPISVHVRSKKTMKIT